MFSVVGLMAFIALNTTATAQQGVSKPGRFVIAVKEVDDSISIKIDGKEVKKISGPGIFGSDDLIPQGYNGLHTVSLELYNIAGPNGATLLLQVDEPTTERDYEGSFREIKLGGKGFQVGVVDEYKFQFSRKSGTESNSLPPPSTTAKSADSAPPSTTAKLADSAPPSTNAAFSYSLALSGVDDSVRVTAWPESNPAKIASIYEGNSAGTFNLDNFLPVKDESWVVRVQLYNAAGPSGVTVDLSEVSRPNSAGTKVSRSCKAWNVGWCVDFQARINRATGEKSIIKDVTQ